MKRRLPLLLMLFFPLLACAALPDNYEKLPAEEKQLLLWQEVTKSHQDNPLPSLSGNSFKEILLKLKGFFYLSPTFDYVSDEMPAGRIKIIHANGAVGKIAFVPAAGHPFTGIFKTGAVGIARFSLAVTPTDTQYTPGLAIKFLLPKLPSLNLQVMNSVDGQGNNWNYFANDFSNKIPHANSLVLRAIEKIFQLTQKPANELSTWRLATWDNTGAMINKPVYPEKLYFKPSSRIANAIDTTSRQDFRLSLADIKMGPIYEVYGDYQGISFYIGSLQLDSTILASDYGDKKLFFAHPR